MHFLCESFDGFRYFEEFPIELDIRNHLALLQFKVVVVHRHAVRAGESLQWHTPLCSHFSAEEIRIHLFLTNIKAEMLDSPDVKGRQ